MTDTPTRPPLDHPAPTFARTTWSSLDGRWHFDQGTAGDSPSDWVWDSRIEVPFPPESAASGLGLARCDHPRYHRTFSVMRAEGQRVLLHCEGIDHHARVWVDDHLVGEHTGGYTPFVLDITEALADDEVHDLVIAATDLARDLEQPRGKQDWHDDPHMIWYDRSSGIWRSVWLEVVPAVRLASVAWTTRDTIGHLDGTVTITGWDETDPLTVEATFACEGVDLGTVRAEATASVVELGTRLGRAAGADTPWLYWTPESPLLIDVRLRLLRGEVVLDEVASYTGLRTIAVRDGVVELNGQAMFSRLVLEQAFWPESHFTAPSADAVRAEAALVKELGFNGLRMHQVSADPRFLRACDEMGLMVWADVPAAYVPTVRSTALHTHTLSELIARDRNHPCVVAWVPYNESWGVPEVADDARQQAAVRAAYWLAKALDPTRLVIGNDGWENVVGDLVGVHDYTHDPAVLTARYGTPDAVATTIATARPGARVLLAAPHSAGTPVLLSEFGGVSLARGDQSWGYGGVADADALVDQVRALAAAVGEASGVVGFCWTQLTDCRQEQNGLAWPDRTPKAPVRALAAALHGRSPRPVDGLTDPGTEELA
ncbi:MAG: glycoside hydrolase family 2 TIM barrel-domain containing protein [Propionibacteriaceae bacterium]|nr:glycoside hydrolase family 2 TIM barrel-domain containing protein [Propionibacteriaceae bacterium]